MGHTLHKPASPTNTWWIVGGRNPIQLSISRFNSLLPWRSSSVAVGRMWTQASHCSEDSKVTCCRVGESSPVPAEHKLNKTKVVSLLIFLWTEEAASSPSQDSVHWLGVWRSRTSSGDLCGRPLQAPHSCLNCVGVKWALSQLWRHSQGCFSH